VNPAVVDRQSQLEVVHESEHRRTERGPKVSFALLTNLSAHRFNDLASTLPDLLRAAIDLERRDIGRAAGAFAADAVG
jgi:hypothetical protein